MFILGSPKTNQLGNHMKKITILLVIIFTLLFTNTSWGDWNYVTENTSGDKFYYDKDRIRKSGKYIYFWELIDYLKPNKLGNLSSIQYIELDCSIFRVKWLKEIFYKKSMGEGEMTGEWTPKDELRYPKPNSVTEYMYNRICEEYQHLSSPVIGDNHKVETLYRWGEYPNYVWKGFGDKDIHPKYEGDVENGVPNGLGLVIFPSGHKYVGSWKNGKHHGQGTFTNPDGNKYVGGYKDGKMNGQGTYTSPKGYKYIGEYKDGLTNGQGTETYTDGSKYVGEFKDGKKDGQGTYTFPNGTKYVGE